MKIIRSLCFSNQSHVEQVNIIQVSGISYLTITVYIFRMEESYTEDHREDTEIHRDFRPNHFW